MTKPLRFAIGASVAISGGGPASGGGSTRAGAGVTDFPQKSFELHRREAHQRARRDRAGADEGVRHALGAEREPARGQVQARVADVEREVPVEHVEPFILFGMHVPRRTVAGRDDDFEQAEAAVGVGACRSSRSAACRGARTPRLRRAPARNPVLRDPRLLSTSHPPDYLLDDFV